MIQTIKVLLVCFCLFGTTSTYAQLYNQKTDVNGASQTEESVSEQKASQPAEIGKSDRKTTLFPTNSSGKPTLKATGGGGGGFDEGGSEDNGDGFNDAPAGDIAWIFLAGLCLAYGVTRKRRIQA